MKKRVGVGIIIWVLINYSFAFCSLPKSLSIEQMKELNEIKAEYGEGNSPLLVKSVPAWLHSKEEASGSDFKRLAEEYFDNIENVNEIMRSLELWVRSLPKTDLYEDKEMVNNPSAFPLHTLAVRRYCDRFYRQLFLSEKGGAAMDLNQSIRNTANLYRLLQAMGTQYGSKKAASHINIAEFFLSVRIKLLKDFLEYLDSFGSNNISAEAAKELERLNVFMDLELPVEKMLENKISVLRANFSMAQVYVESGYEGDGTKLPLYLQWTASVWSSASLAFEKHMKDYKKSIQKDLEMWKTDPNLFNSFDRKKASKDLKDKMEEGNTLAYAKIGILGQIWVSLAINELADLLCSLHIDSTYTYKTIFCEYNEMGRLKNRIADLAGR